MTLLSGPSGLQLTNYGIFKSDTCGVWETISWKSYRNVLALILTKIDDTMAPVPRVSLARRSYTRKGQDTHLSGIAPGVQLSQWICSPTQCCSCQRWSGNTEYLLGHTRIRDRSGHCSNREWQVKCFWWNSKPCFKASSNSPCQYEV